MSAGTDLYQRVILAATGQHSDLMRRVWGHTPWMIETFTGGHVRNPARHRAMREWCCERYGEESALTIGRTGLWQFGGVTINGRTWVGFATEAQLTKFLEAWPEPPND